MGYFSDTTFSASSYFYSTSNNGLFTWATFIDNLLTLQIQSIHTNQGNHINRHRYPLVHKEIEISSNVTVFNMKMKTAFIIKNNCILSLAILVYECFYSSPNSIFLCQYNCSFTLNAGLLTIFTLWQYVCTNMA